MAFHNGRPFEFLHRVSATATTSRWLVRPLFVADPVSREEIFRDGDRLTPLHTKTP